MKTRTAITLIHVLSGRYDLPGPGVTLKGFDQYGEPVSEEIPRLDHVRLTADVDTAIIKLLEKEDRT